MRQILHEPIFDLSTSITIGPAGELVRPGDPESMANGILKVIHQKDLFDEFAKNGPLRVAHSYSAQKVLKQYQDLYLANLFTNWPLTNEVQNEKANSKDILLLLFNNSVFSFLKLGRGQHGG
jgi:hypothetical protein